MTLFVYKCRNCGQAAPDEWGTGRRCPEHPSKGQIPPYMQECEFCPIPGVERDRAIEVVKELMTTLAACGVTAEEKQAVAKAHNWLVDAWPREPGDPSIVGYVPEVEG